MPLTEPTVLETRRKKWRKAGWLAAGVVAHSYLRATIGSTRAARRAGITHAANATPISDTATRAKVAGSRTVTPNTRLDTVRPRANPPARPTDTPTRTTFIPSRT